jgi:hypothetical protein
MANRILFHVIIDGEPVFTYSDDVPGGQKMYQLNAENGQVDELDYTRCDTMDYGFGEGYMFLKQPNYLYCFALNFENAGKHFVKQLKDANS